jgi:hypothetical protein
LFHSCSLRGSQAYRRPGSLAKHIGTYHIHGLLMIVRLKQVSVTVHCDLQAAMARKSLHRFWA